MPGSLIEIWQANAAGRYVHQRRPAPGAARPELHRRRPRASQTPRAATASSTVKPGAYPWRNHGNAWRPAHIHLSVFGRAFTERLVTQMYFPGDPLFSADPIFQLRPRPGGAGAADLAVRLGDDDPTSGRSASASTSSLAAATRPRSMSTWRRGRPPRRPSGRSSRSASASPASRAGRSGPRRRRAHRRPGARRRRRARLDAMVEIWQADATAGIATASAGGGAGPTPTAATASSPSSPAATARRRIWPCWSSPAAS